MPDITGKTITLGNTIKFINYQSKLFHYVKNTEVYLGCDNAFSHNLCFRTGNNLRNEW